MDEITEAIEHALSSDDPTVDNVVDLQEWKDKKERERIREILCNHAHEVFGDEEE